MATTPDPWFVTERSEALTRVWLTNRPDVHVRGERRLEDRLLLYVEIGSGDPLSAQQFVVQVKGALSADPNEWLRMVEPWFGHPDQPIWLPMCVIVVNVRENKAFYSWLAEPHVEGDTPVLRSTLSPTFHPLDAAAIDEIVDQVKAWYQALPRQLLPA